MSRFNTRNLDSLGSEFSIPISADDDGYLGRECPVQECLGYFKLTPGTGIKGPAPCHCPYCGHSGESKTFFTQEQIDYARSVVLRKVTDALHKDLKSLEFDHKPQGLFGIGLSLKVERDRHLCPSATTVKRNSKPRSSATTALCAMPSTGFLDGALTAAFITRCRFWSRT